MPSGRSNLLYDLIHRPALQNSRLSLREKCVWICTLTRMDEPWDHDLEAPQMFAAPDFDRAAQLSFSRSTIAP